MKYSAQKRSVQRSGIASLGWRIGFGFVKEKITVKSDAWCVVNGANVLAECRSKSIANQIAEALNTSEKSK